MAAYSAARDGAPASFGRQINFRLAPSSPWITDTRLGGSPGSSGSPGALSSPGAAASSDASQPPTLAERLKRERLLSMPQPREMFVGGSPIDRTGLALHDPVWRRDSDRSPLPNLRDVTPHLRSMQSHTSPMIITPHRRPAAETRIKMTATTTTTTTTTKTTKQRTQIIRPVRISEAARRPPTPPTRAPKATTAPAAHEIGTAAKHRRAHMYGGRTTRIAAAGAIPPPSRPAVVILPERKRGVSATRPAAPRASLENTWGLLGTVIRDECDLAGCPLGQYPVGY